LGRRLEPAVRGGAPEKGIDAAADLVGLHPVRCGVDLELNRHHLRLASKVSLGQTMTAVQKPTVRRKDDRKRQVSVSYAASVFCNLPNSWSAFLAKPAIAVELRDSINPDGLSRQ
jgi:hypothetical protein